MANPCLHLFVRPSFALGVNVQQQCLGTWRLPIAFCCPRLRLAVTSCIHPAAPPNLLPRQKTCTRTVSRKYLHLHCETVRGVCLPVCLSTKTVFALLLHCHFYITTVPSSHKKAPLILTDKSGDSTLPPPYPTRTPLIRVYLTL